MSDHASLTIIIPIVKEHINTRKHTIVKDSKEEQLFIKDLFQALRNIDMSNIVNFSCLNSIINKFASTIESMWKIQRLSTSQFTLRAGGTLSVVMTWIYTDPPEV